MALSYLACTVAATWPVARHFSVEIPGQLTDPLEHLWIMRWARSCLLDGRSPFFCPGLNYPTGIPLGYFPTMHLQSAAYLILQPLTGSDVASFNVLWTFGFVSTGISTFLLAWWATRRVGPSWLAGLGAMLCGPMMMHAHGHLETMQMGAVPLFLMGWIRFVDRPGMARLLAAGGLYLLVVACAPYFAVLAVFPAAWYLAWSALVEGSGRRRWLLGRLGWLVGFAATALPGLLVLFASQIWAAWHGYPMGRPRSQFDQLGAPTWSTFVPSPMHALGKFAVPDVFERAGYTKRVWECSSYLGVVTLGLLAYAGFRRVRFARRGFWWSALGLMVVLSWGSHLEVGSTRVGLPAGWIYNVFPPFHLIRVPARFNLFAGVCAAVPAAAGLADLLGRIGGRTGRTLVVAGLAGLTLVDLNMVPFGTSPIPPMPSAYRDLAGSTLVDAPTFGSDEGQTYSSLWGYWQSFHGAKTTAGYPGLPNSTFEAEVVRPSPFWSGRLIDPAYLSGSGPDRFGAAIGVDPRAYAWLYLTAHRFDHVVFHHEPWFDPKYAEGSRRARGLLDGAWRAEAEGVAVFDRSKLGEPDRLVWLCGEGFRPALAASNSWKFGVLRSARVVAFDPEPGRPVALTLVDASAFGKARVVRLTEGGRELARWTVGPGTSKTLESPPFRLGAGVRELRLESDGETKPARYADRVDDAKTPYGWRLDGLRLHHPD